MIRSGTRSQGSSLRRPWRGTAPRGRTRGRGKPLQRRQEFLRQHRESRRKRMKLVRPAVGHTGNSLERAPGIDQHEVVRRVGGQSTGHCVKAVDHRRDDGEPFGEVVAAEVERRLEPRARTQRRDAVRDRVVVAMSDDRLAGQDRVPQGEEIKIRGANGAQRSVASRPEPS
jgi:hypothetical protein